MNSYASIDDLKGSAVLDITGTVNDGRYRQLLEAVSREVDKFTHREFYATQETRYFSGNGSVEVLWGDYVSIGSGSLKEDSNGDGTFDTTWAGSGSGSSDWYSSPYNSDPTSAQTAKPFTRLEVNRNSNGTQDVFEKGQRNYEVAGVWGYSSVSVTLGIMASASFDSTATVFQASGGTLEAGWTIGIGTEQMYVQSVVAGATVTVVRGVNGYVAGDVGSATSFTRLDYPGPIREAVIMQAGRLANRAKGGYSQEMGLPEAGEVVPIVANGLDNDVKQMIGGYRKLMLG